MTQYFKNIWNALYTVAVGMKITMKHYFVPAVTLQYPLVKPVLPERERNRLYVNFDDCIGCDQCARACPVSCITIETAKSLPTEDLGKTSNGKKKALWVTKFEIDFAKCCYCQLCVFPCPTECIYMTDVYEFSEYQRQGLAYNFSTLTPDEAVQKKLAAEKFEAEKALEKAQALAAQKAAAAAAPKPEVTPKTDQPVSKANEEAKTVAPGVKITTETTPPPTGSEGSIPADDKSKNNGEVKQ